MRCRKHKLTLFFAGFRRFCRNFPPPTPPAPPPTPPPAPSFLLPFSSPIFSVEQVCGLKSDAKDPQDCRPPSPPAAPSLQSPSPSGPIRSQRLLAEGVFGLPWLWCWPLSDWRNRGLTCATVRWYLSTVWVQRSRSAPPPSSKAKERASWKREGGIGGRETRGQVEDGGEEEVEETASHHWVAYKRQMKKDHLFAFCKIVKSLIWLSVPQSMWTAAAVCYPGWSSSRTDSGTCLAASPLLEEVGPGRRLNLPSPAHTSLPNHWALIESHCAAPKGQKVRRASWLDTFGRMGTILPGCGCRNVTTLCSKARKHTKASNLGRRKTSLKFRKIPQAYIVAYERQGMFARMTSEDSLGGYKITFLYKNTDINNFG